MPDQFSTPANKDCDPPVDVATEDSRETVGGDTHEMPPVPRVQSVDQASAGVPRVFISEGDKRIAMSKIVSTDGVMGGQPRIEGRRISVVQIVEWIQEEGMEPETVTTEFDLDLADVYRALTYYYDNVDELRTYRERRERRRRESADQHPSPDSVLESA